MSRILLLVVRNNKVWLSFAHYRDALRLIEHSPEPSTWLDAGYLVIDHDRKAIISCQSALSAKHLLVGKCSSYAWVTA